MLAANAWLLTRGAPVGVRFVTIMAMGILYGVALVAWQRLRAQR
jgi:hypothetical protein